MGGVLGHLYFKLYLNTKLFLKSVQILYFLLAKVSKFEFIDENEEETFVELTEEEYRVLTDVALPIPDGIDLSDEEDDSDDYEDASDNENNALSDNENNAESANENPEVNLDNVRENTVT